MIRFVFLRSCLAIFLITANLPVSAQTVKNRYQNDLQNSDVPTKLTFQGTGTGPIPDAPGDGPRNYGTPLNISFNVSGVSGGVGSVEIDFNASHTFVGDLKVTLISPKRYQSKIV